MGRQLKLISDVDLFKLQECLLRMFSSFIWWAIIIMAGLSVIKHKNPAYFCVAFICLSVHLAYGLGTLKGLMVNGERL